MQKISIIVPAHNEEFRIEDTLIEYCLFFEDLAKNKKLDFEIVVVLNACKDNTMGVVKKIKMKHEKISILDFEQGGKGFAILEGFKDALKRENNLIGFVDADMATKPEAFYDLIKNIEGYDGIIASRWKKGSIVKERKSIIRKSYSAVFNFLVRSLLFLNYKDTQCGAKILKRNAVEEILPRIGITQWAFDLDLLYKLKKKKFKIKERITIWEDKADSKVSFIAPIQMFTALIRLRILDSPFKFIIKLYDRLPEKIKVHNWKR